MRIPLVLLALTLTAQAEVRLTGQPGKWQLQRDGKPYFVKGVGGDRSLELLAKAGGNSFRLWGDEQLGEKLDAAHKLGLTVTAGIWLGQVRQGFDWSDAAGLIKQREHIRAVVEKHKNHPALLIWALGNEMEDGEGKNGAVWGQINNLARMVKEIDPGHPVMTVVAEIGGDKVKNFHALCPDVDLLGINSYGGVTSVAERYAKAGGTKPYLLTEFGPPGIWEVKKDAIGAYPELTSTQKGAIYRRAYESAVLAAPGRCLGSYAFLWGQKQEVTATWFSLFLADGARLGGVDALTEMWSGKPQPNRVPTIASLALTGAPSAKPGATVTATLTAADPDKDPLKVTWLLQRDPGEYGTGGDAEEAPPTFPEAITKSDATSATITFPKDGGLYRLFAMVRDDHGGGAVANVPLRVEAPQTVAAARRATLPLSIYAEAGDDEPFIPAGWMGDAKAMRVDPASMENPHSGKTSMRCEFNADKGWGGVVWQSPAGDWGDRGAGLDLTGAKAITFWARGAQGGEVVTFKFGIIAKEKRFHDTATAALGPVTLTKEWQRYEIPVAGKDLTRVKTGFVWTLAAAGQPIAFHLDDIRWE